MNNTNTAVADKKATRQHIVAILEKALSEYTKGQKISKQLHKKIKKAGRIISEAVLEIKKPGKTEIKKRVKKSPVKKVVKKKVAGK